MTYLNSTSAAVLVGLIAFSGSASSQHFRFENALQESQYEIEARINVTNSFDVLVSHQAKEEVEGMEYGLSLAYLRYTKFFTPKIIGQFDAGLGYETFGETFTAIGSQVSEDFSDSASNLWTTAGINYLATPELLVGVDATASQNIKNETLTDTYRGRATIAYQPVKEVKLVYRIGMAYAKGDFSKFLADASDTAVAGDFIVSQELYAGYKSKMGLEPYLMLKDMNNSGDRISYAGLLYHF